MVEYLFTNFTSGTNVPIHRYGKIVRVRWAYTGTIADAKYMALRIVQVNSGRELFFIQDTLSYNAAGSLGVFSPYGSMEVNIEIDYDTSILMQADVGSINLRVWLDIVETRLSKQRQFADNLSGLHNSSGGYAT